MNLEIQAEPHLACFDILKCNWDQDKGYIEVDFGEGRIVGFHCHAKKLEFALQNIQAFGERCQGLDDPTFNEQMRSLYHQRLFCDLHKKDQENYVAIYKFDRLGKDLECVGHHFHKPVTKMHKSLIEEDTWLYLKELAEMHF
jgi:hypothetical protein